MSRFHGVAGLCSEIFVRGQLASRERFSNYRNKEGAAHVLSQHGEGTEHRLAPQGSSPLDRSGRAH